MAIASLVAYVAIGVDERRIVPLNGVATHVNLPPRCTDLMGCVGMASAPPATAGGAVVV